MRFLFYSFILLNSLLYAQNEVKTVQLFNPQTNDLSPIIAMDEYLIFSFDDMQVGYKRYEYQIVRYDRFWEPSNLFQSEYIDGYQQNYIRDYQNSFNTRVRYTHYEVRIPNRDFSFKLSGNYGIQLLDPQSKKVIAEKRFAVYDDMVDVGVKVERINNFKDKNQQVSVFVGSPNFDLTQNVQESLMVILKNNNWNDRIVLSEPLFAQPRQFSYNQRDNIFAGGVEYNWFDTKSLEIAGLTTEKVIRDEVYKTVLYTDAFDPSETYLDRPDVNGNYYIRNINIPNSTRVNSESDYTRVYFALAEFQPKENEEICVYGAFNDFMCDDESTLTYVPETGLYETDILLKQGYYNYSYAVKNTENGKIDYNKITGSYWETENLYNALMYYRPWGKRYDLLIGYGEGYSRPSLR